MKKYLFFGLAFLLSCSAGKEPAKTETDMVYDNRYEGGFFNRDSRYYFAVEAFNENGVTSSTGVFEA
ncbi:MAG: hypothetical protein LBC47_01400, partial [Tannerella sp.]|nr:hypothetical protein [Tannerella sp.]